VGAIAIGDAGAVPDLTAQAAFSDGFSATLDPGQCKELPPPYVCTFMVYGSPMWTRVTITVNTPDYTVTQTVNLAAFNSCGREIAYLPFFVASGTEPTFGEVSYINPCRLLN
jgi:hypothetical protein